MELAAKINRLSELELRRLLYIDEFKQRFPWIGGDLQTLRDTFIREELQTDSGKRIEISIPQMPNKKGGSGKLLALLDLPKKETGIKALVILIHGLGGSTKRQGLRRMGLTLQNSGFAVLRLNLRGADPGRKLAPGSYAAECNSDIEPVLEKARQLCQELSKYNLTKNNPLPLFGAGISLGGTILLNICLKNNDFLPVQSLDGLICTSSPLDLSECSKSIERSRNKFYQNWLLNRLLKQTLADKTGLGTGEEKRLTNEFNSKVSNRSIRLFDSIITAPRWGYADVEDYYKKASPINNLIKKDIILPPTLILQAEDDPWVPCESAKLLDLHNRHNINNSLNILISKNGGHNGFHGINGCWGDQVVKNWFDLLLNEYIKN